MKRKILFICKKRVDSYGVSVGLLNSASFVANYLNDNGVESKLVSVIDANGIDKEVKAYDPTDVVTEALWITPSKFIELLPLHWKRNWYIRLHSKAPFLANEGMAMTWISCYKRIIEKFPNLQLSCNNEEFNNDLTATLGIDSIYLPNIYYPGKPHDHFHPSHCCDKKDGEINIGCFGAIRPLKNHLIQAMSAIVFADSNDLTLNFYVNADRLEQRGENVLKNMRGLFGDTKHNLVECPWTNHEDFIKLVKTMDLGMQVSFSESFNIVAADFISNNIPIVVSPDISWASNLYKADPTSMQSIVDTLQMAWRYKGLGLQRLNTASLWWYNKNAEGIWLDQFCY